MEWAPNDNITVFFDTIINDQDRDQESSRIQASGVSDLRNFSVPTAFEEVDFGPGLGTIQAALQGVIPIEEGGADPNFRASTDTGSRDTRSEIYRLGFDWSYGRFSGRAEASSTQSDTSSPSFNTTLNFINPNVPTNDSNENGTPFAYDLSGGSLAFGVAFGELNAPTTAQLLDPANYLLRDVNIAQDTTDNEENAFRLDFSYEADWGPVTSVDAGYRFNRSTSENNDVRSNVGLRNFIDSPNGSLFADVLTAGPDNFDDADGRDLFVQDFLLIDPSRVNSDGEEVLNILNAAIATNAAASGSDRGPISEPTSNQAAFFDIEEETNALYLQVNFEQGIFRGNIGLRYIDTDIDSRGNSILDGVTVPREERSGYDFFLPRINLVANVRENVAIRASYGQDIRRPDFDDLSTSVTFSTSPNPAVAIGNPGLLPEEVDSFDISVEYYFAPNAVVSVGYFNKQRDGLFVSTQDNPFEDPVTGFRDTTDPCEQGGIFNPIADINVFGPENGVGVCVPFGTTINGEGDTTQQGIEVAFQYDLSHFEDKLGWASGFGFLANYTNQDFSGGDTFLSPTARADAIFTALGNPDFTLRAPLIDFSENAFNVTLYYEKFGLSARARYTWREAFRSEDFGSTTSLPFGFPVVQDDRGQLNASINYDVNDHLSIGVEGVNLTESDVEQNCVNENALLCFQGLTDRRIQFGASYRF